MKNQQRKMNSSLRKKKLFFVINFTIRRKTRTINFNRNIPFYAASIIYTTQNTLTNDKDVTNENFLFSLFIFCVSSIPSFNGRTQKNKKKIRKKHKINQLCQENVMKFITIAARNRT